MQGKGDEFSKELDETKSQIEEMALREGYDFSEFDNEYELQEENEDHLKNFAKLSVLFDI